MWFGQRLPISIPTCQFLQHCHSHSLTWFPAVIQFLFPHWKSVLYWYFLQLPLQQLPGDRVSTVFFLLTATISAITAVVYIKKKKHNVAGIFMGVTLPIPYAYQKYNMYLFSGLWQYLGHVQLHDLQLLLYYLHYCHCYYCRCYYYHSQFSPKLLSGRKKEMQIMIYQVICGRQMLSGIKICRNGACIWV